MNDYRPERVSVGQLFKSDKQLMIPRFQRSYEWKEANIEEFYNDFVQTSDEHLTFLGNIVVDASKTTSFEVIDGQQRLITLTILCAVIRDILKEDIKTELAYDLASRIDTTYLKKGVSFSSSTASPYKLVPSKELEDFFRSYIQQGGERSRKALPRHPSHKNVERAYKKFRTLISNEKLSGNVGDDQKVAFLEQTMERLHAITLIVIEIYNQDAAYAIFESFNAKRVDLSVADLVKNYYFSKLSGTEDTVSSNMDRWDRVVTIITSIPGGKVDRFLHYYLQSKEGKFTKAQLYRKVRAEIDAGPEKFIKNLERATAQYEQLKDSNVISDAEYQISYETLNKLNAALEGINRFNVEQCFIFLLSVMQNRQKLTPLFIAKIVELVESFTFVFSKITNGQANVLEGIYSDFSLEINKAKIPEDPAIYAGQFHSKFQKALADKLPRFEVFQAEFKELSYSNPQQKRLISYIFERTEEFNTRGGSMLGQLANIDHIFPQNPKSKKRPSHYHKIGNLLPIDRDTNSKVGNKLPEDKISIYEGIPNITQVKTFLDFIDENGTEMNDEMIDKRAELMAKDSYEKVWSLNKK